MNDTGIWATGAPKTGALDFAVNRRRASKADLLCRVGRRQTGGHELQRGTDLVGVERLASRQFAAHASGGDSVFGSLRDQAPLEMCDRAEHMEHQLAGGG